MNRLYLLFVLFFLASCSLWAQFNLDNSSFEDTPRDATVPTGWYQVKMGSTPDILPGFWDVDTPPSEGNTYIGLITREDGSWESIGQRLPQAVKKGECYSFKMDIAKADTYEGYNLPIRIRVWGGKTRYTKDQLIGEVGPVKSTEWASHDFQFYANQKINYIILEAYYMKGMMIPYKGNVLIDNITTFERCIRAAIDVQKRDDFLRG